MENQVEMTQFLAMDEREEEMSEETHCSLLQLTQAPTIDIQAELRNAYEENSDLVDEVGIIVFDNESNLVTPAFFFAKGEKSTIYLGSSYKDGTTVDFVLDKKCPSGNSYIVSNTALCFTYSHEQDILTMESTNGPDFVLKGKKFEYIHHGDKRNIYDGDKLLFKFSSENDPTQLLTGYTIQFHHAPLHSTTVDGTDNEISGKAVDPSHVEYRKQDRTNLKKANKQKEQVKKAIRQVKSGKKMRKVEKKQLLQTISQAKKTPCKAEQRHGNCNDKQCPYQHSTASNISEYKNFPAVIVKWIPEKHYGFAENDDGYRFFVHISQCKEGSVTFAECGKLSIVQVGAKITIGSVQLPKISEKSGKVPKAFNVAFD